MLVTNLPCVYEFVSFSLLRAREDVFAVLWWDARASWGRGWRTTTILSSTHRGLEFWMVDEAGGLVFCRVSHEALRDHANRIHLDGTDNEVFEAYQELIEQVVSDAFDAEGIVDEAGRILVTSEALARVGRSA